MRKTLNFLTHFWQHAAAILLTPSAALPGTAPAHHPVFLRAPFGVRGANFAAILRAVVACGWFGIQPWIGGTAIHAMLAVIWPATGASGT